MTKHELSDAELEALFTAARDTPRVPDPGFLDQLVAQAEAVIGSPAPVPVPRRVRLRDLLGGWPAMGGLALATCAGVWIGVSPPALLPDPAAYLLSSEEAATYETMILNPGAAWDAEEG